VTAWRLGRGHLVRRAAASKLVDVVARMCGVHAQLVSSVPLALGARLHGLRHSHVDAALRDDRTLVKTWGMRGTLHVFTADDLPLYCAAQRTRDQYTNPSFLKNYGLEPADVSSILDAISRALDGRALPREQLAEEILRITKRPHLEERLRSGWGEMLKPAAFRGLLCFGPQEGRSVSFVRPDQWLGRWEEHDTDEALVWAFRRFLSAYASASRAELARWWGVRPPEVGRVMKLMSDELVEVEVGGGVRVVLESDLRSIQRARPAEGVRLLPSFDQILVMSAPHADAIVDEVFSPRIYRPRIAVWSLPGVLVDGRVRAAWKIERKRDHVVARVEPFERLAGAVRTALDDEVARLGNLLGTEARLELAPP
jgi:hypothetical protein